MSCFKILPNLFEGIHLCFPPGVETRQTDRQTCCGTHQEKKTAIVFHVSLYGGESCAIIIIILLSHLIHIPTPVQGFGSYQIFKLNISPGYFIPSPCKEKLQQQQKKCQHDILNWDKKLNLSRVKCKLIC